MRLPLVDYPGWPECQRGARRRGMKNAVANGLLCTRALVLCLASLLLPICSVSGMGPAPRPQGGTGVLPDSWGAIAEITLQYDSQLSDALEPMYRDLFGALPIDVRFRVLCPSVVDAQQFIATWKMYLGGRAVDVVNAGLPMSVWARDRCIPTQSGDLTGPVSLFAPLPEATYLEERENDLIVCEWLGEVLKAPTRPVVTLRIDGGNLVSNRRHVFIGANVLSENDRMDKQALAEALELLSGRKYVLVGDEHGEVPWCHVDMYLTPIDDDTVLVASPRFGLELIGQHCDEGEDPSKNLSLGAACPSDLLQERFDAVATLLGEYGYRVRRIPALVNVPDEWMVTYNNVLIDHRAGHRTVYLPFYGLSVLDDVAAAVYSGLGFEVQPVDVSGVFESGGAVRCIVNVTKRRPPFLISRAEPRRIRLINLAEPDESEGTTVWRPRRVAGLRCLGEGRSR